MRIRSYFEHGAPLVFSDGRTFTLDTIQTSEDLRLAVLCYSSPVRYQRNVHEGDLVGARFGTSPLEQPRLSFHPFIVLCNRAGVQELELRFIGKYSLDREYCFRLSTDYFSSMPPDRFLRDSRVLRELENPEMYRRTPPTTKEIVEAYARRQREDKGGPIIVRGEAVSLDTARAAWATMLRGKVKASDEARAEKERRIVLGPIDDPDHA